MRFLDFFSSSDESVGNEVLSSYYNEAIKFEGFQYDSYETWVSWLNSRVPDFVSFVGELVKSTSASQSVGDAVERVALLANSSKGMATIPQITQTSGGRGDTVNWAQGIPDIVGETLYDAGEAVITTAQNVGEGALSTLKLTKYLPYILVGGAALYLALLAKGQSKAISKALRGK